MSIAVVVAVIAGVTLGPLVLLLPLCCLAAVVVALSFALWLSALNVLYRDVYGWFDRVSLGVYDLSPRGKVEIPLWNEKANDSRSTR